MADFCITHVRYNKDKTHITYVKVREEIVVDKKIKLGPSRTVARGFVADLIRLDKATFQTRVLNDNNQLARGAKVHLFDEEYLSTDKNSSKRDNLGNLPEF